jgi:putative membrane protein
LQFLKILFWCLLAFVAALFTYSNWNSIEIHLWSGLIAAVNLPLLLLVTFLIGFLPTYLYMGARRWRLRQRLTTSERNLADLRIAAVAPSPTLAEPTLPVATPLPIAPAGEVPADTVPVSVVPVAVVSAETLPVDVAPVPAVTAVPAELEAAPSATPPAATAPDEPLAQGRLV